VPDILPVRVQDLMHCRQPGLREVAPERVHLFSVLGDRLALDIASGAVHLLDEVSWDVLSDLVRGDDGLSRAVARHSPEEATAASVEIQELIRQGLLFSQAAPYPRLSEEPLLKALCLNVSHDCNLRCAYCFAGTGAYRQARSSMPPEVGRAAVDFLISGARERATCEIDFFGGEPLLAMPVVKHVVKYAGERGRQTGKTFRFTLTTNATLLGCETTEFLNANRMQVVLSLDGRKQTNDRLRAYPSGSGSHDDVLRRIQEFLDSRNATDYYVRGTYTSYNLDFTRDAEHLLASGIGRFSLEPVVAAPEHDYAIRPEHLPSVIAEYDRLLALYIDRRRQGRPFVFYHFEVDLSGGPCLAKRMSGCGAGREYLAVAPDGSIYPCHQFDGEYEFKMGNVLDGPGAIGETGKGVRDAFGASNLGSKVQCPDCWARYYCGGGCYRAAWARNGRLDQPDAVACEIQKKRLECAIYAQATQH